MTLTIQRVPVLCLQARLSKDRQRRPSRDEFFLSKGRLKPEQGLSPLPFKTRRHFNGSSYHGTADGANSAAAHLGSGPGQK